MSNRSKKGTPPYPGLVLIDSEDGSRPVYGLDMLVLAIEATAPNRLA